MRKSLLTIFGMLFILNTYAQEQLIEANNNFSFKVYKATKTDSANFFISPFSLNLALSMANEGARKGTRQEMDRLLSIQDIEYNTVQYHELISKTTRVNNSIPIGYIEPVADTLHKEVLRLANSIWLNDKLRVEDSFKNTARENFRAGVYGFSPSNLPAANEALNKWISEETNGKIPKINGLSKDTDLAIINAIYFLGEWAKPFDVGKTKTMSFHTLGKEEVDISFMKNTSRFNYYEDSEIQSLTLPYKANQFSMIVILPKERYGILEVEKKLDAEYLKRIDHSKASHRVNVSFPKFKIESELQPKEQFIAMGNPIMFSDDANFSGISTSKHLKIDNIVHKTFIEVDELKTEAAAFSMAEVVVIGYGGPSSPPKEFNADHPFIFLILDNSTGAILFMGRFVED